jgi:hypothetical protein
LRLSHQPKLHLLHIACHFQAAAYLFAVIEITGRGASAAAAIVA